VLRSLIRASENLNVHPAEFGHSFSSWILACMIMTGLVIQSERSYKHMSHIQGLQIYKGSSKSKHFYCVVKMARNFITLQVPVQGLQSSNWWNNQFRPSTILTTHISTTWILMCWGTQMTWCTSKLQQLQQ